MLYRLRRPYTTIFFSFFLFSCLTHLPCGAASATQPGVNYGSGDSLSAVPAQPGHIYVGPDARGDEVVRVTPPRQPEQPQPVIPYIIPQVNVPTSSYPPQQGWSGNTPSRPGRPYPGQPSYPPSYHPYPPSMPGGMPPNGQPGWQPGWQPIPPTTMPPAVMPPAQMIPPSQTFPPSQVVPPAHLQPPAVRPPAAMPPAVRPPMPPSNVRPPSFPPPSAGQRPPVPVRPPSGWQPYPMPYGGAFNSPPRGVPFAPRNAFMPPQAPRTARPR